MRRKLKHFMLKTYNGLPFEYTPVEYLESTGTQWIQTETLLDANSKLDVTWAAIRKEVGLWRLICCSPSIFTAWQDYKDDENARLRVDVNGSPTHFPTFQMRDQQKNRITYSSGRITFNGEEGVCNVGSTQTSGTARLFYGYSLPIGYASAGRAYEVCIKNDGVTALQLIPALDPTGTPCMYDLVSKQPFYNRGTGDFLYPTDSAPAMTTDLDEKFYAKLTEHGIRRLYHVPNGCTLTKDEYAAENGFKILVEPPMPEEGYWRPEWRETETEIICDWIETEPYNIEEE
jgi:hypothetical protein